MCSVLVSARGSLSHIVLVHGLKNELDSCVVFFLYSYFLQTLHTTNRLAPDCLITSVLLIFLLEKEQFSYRIKLVHLTF